MYKNPELTQIGIDFCTQKYNKVFTDYTELAQVINLEFGEQVTAEDIWNYYEPESSDKIVHNSSLKINY